VSVLNKNYRRNNHRRSQGNQARLRISPEEELNKNQPHEEPRAKASRERIWNQFRTSIE